MATTERVTVTLPTELVREIDRRESNRSRFLTEAVRNELVRRRREELARSLASPHPEACEVAELGFDAWGANFAADGATLVDPTAGTSVRWVEGTGFVEDRS